MATDVLVHSHNIEQQRISSTHDYSNVSTMDRLALSRAQHLESRNNRPKSVSDDDDEIDEDISDWSESDRECCPLSDYESTSNVDGHAGGGGGSNARYNMSFDEDDDEVEEDKSLRPTLDIIPSASETPNLLDNVLRIVESPLPIIDDSTTSTRISFTSDSEKPKQQLEHHHIPLITTKKIPEIPLPSRRQSQTREQPPLLPGRRLPTKQPSLPRPSTRSLINSQLSFNEHRKPMAQSSATPSLVSRNRNLPTRKTITSSPSRLYLRRETTSTSLSLNTQLTSSSTNKDLTTTTTTTFSPNNSFQSHEKSLADDFLTQRQLASPNLSQASTIGLVPRAYEIKKLFVDDYDYGRLTESSSLNKSNQPRSRQKWGTIVHPPFPLGYQHASPEQVTQAVERLASPIRCRDRHTPIQSPTKRYLSVEETDALISRLTKVKPIRSGDQYWPAQRQSRSVKTLSNALKTNTNWKGVGIST